MYTSFALSLLLVVAYSSAYSQRNPPPQALNQYVAFLNQSADVVFDRMQMLQSYQQSTRPFRANPNTLLRLPSSGPLEEYDYRKALAQSGLTARESQQLNDETEALWTLLTTFDQSAKALEVYVRLKDYQRDNLQKSDALLADLQKQAEQISRKQDAFYRQIQRIYRLHQPFQASDPYLAIEREMVQILTREKQTLASWPYYLNDEKPADWPVDTLRESMLKDVDLLAGLGKSEAQIAYPASSMIGSFKTALQSIQDLKQDAINNYTFTARQSARHANAVYLSLINHYNNDLLAFYHSFVQYSASARHLLDFPKFSPVFALEPSGSGPEKIGRTAPFQDLPLIPFRTTPSATPASAATFHALNAYIDFINESLRQMNRLQVLVRNYQQSAESHRFPDPSRRRGSLFFNHDDYKVPAADYQLLITNSKPIPSDYRNAINTQAQMLLNILNEMDGLSLELIAYTQGKEYEQDRLKRSDFILDRYAVLFDTFDRKKEQLYADVRRIHESYKPANPASSWHIAGQALLKIMDQDHAALFGVRDFWKGENRQLPATEEIQAEMRRLLTDEYKNLKGLTRYGRSNGLCPYSPYEDLAENSGRFAEKVTAVKPVSPTAPSFATHPYESFYYFYNNELVYQYNKFSELAKTGVLKMINQPNGFLVRRPAQSRPVSEPTAPTTQTPPPAVAPAPPVSASPAPIPAEVAPSLDGFAPNNMVLLLDVSASMESPYKMPLLKKSIKSLLPLLRPEDQVSVVVYSGKARVVLPPTSGARSAEIARAIDDLQSTGETDGNDGIRTAYKVADKHFIPLGNNRIILATDGEFPISESVYESAWKFARKNINLTVLTFGKTVLNSANLKKLATLGQGRYEHVTEEKAQLQLILEAQAQKKP
ncbi:VWA domain-containing protein [Larkinella bovis]|uniref:VWA domain-containing protein n=1 Tax=Larkinella bovis TaxID=683041 RepID=A0ABW0I4H5_9BACT